VWGAPSVASMTRVASALASTTSESNIWNGARRDGDAEWLDEANLLY
jgi:hypothetical protein